jgi:hypothetical protein
MRRTFVPAAILALVLLIYLYAHLIALTIEPITTVNTARRPRIGATR